MITAIVRPLTEMRLEAFVIHGRLQLPKRASAEELRMLCQQCNRREADDEREQVEVADETGVAMKTDLRASFALGTVKKRIRMCGKPAVPNIMRLRSMGLI